MTGEARSLGLLAAIANEHRSALMRVQGGGIPLVQGAIPLKQGSVPLLARLLVLPTKTATRQAVLPPPRTVTTREAPVKSAAAKAAAVGPPAAPKLTPKKYLQELFSELGIGESKMPKRFMNGDFVKPDDEECQSYNDAARLVRNNELEKLRALHKEGKNLDACNRVGESLLHLACRRGHVAIAEFLMNEAKVRWDLQDDFGRTILHDATWRPDPSIELMEALLKVVSPEWLLAEDVRGHTPFEYARREHLTDWYEFLKKREDMLKRRLSLLT